LAQRVAIHYHLRPLDHDETKDYIRFRLARAGGSGIFTASALDKLYEYTQGVPRRINAWCDLALVAGFAEGRHEIDREFIDMVIAAQGGSLEGLGGQDNVGSEELVPLPRTSTGEMPVPDNGLQAAMEELSARLTRLEGLVLEMTSQIIPALTQILRTSTKSEEVLTVEDGQMANATRSPEPASPLSPEKRWWSKFWLV
jgi:hypothetical protein